MHIIVISIKITIMHIILFWDVDFKSHVQFKHFDEKRLCNHNDLNMA